MSALVVLVNVDPRTLRHTEAMLSEHGYVVAAVSSFVDAKELLASVMPDLLIADLRLADYNGLQLAIRSRQDHPEVPVIITSVHEDPIAKADAADYGAAFVAAPLGNPDFLRVAQTAIRQRGQELIRRWSRIPLMDVVEVNAAHTRAQVLDLSYGGVRLAFRDVCQIPLTFDIELPCTDVTITAQRIWTASCATDEECYCGAKLAAEEEARECWRGFVDSVTANARP